MLVDVQKCVRTGDLDDIAATTAISLSFQMLGNWSLGAYFKKEAISWSYEFLTSKEEGLGLDPARLYVTVFEGDGTAPEDTEAPEIWKSLGIPEHRIYKLGADDNWWSPGDNGPKCRSTTPEMFYELHGRNRRRSFPGRNSLNCRQNREDLVEIWNDVFMEYEKKDGKVRGKLAQKNVDTGAGLERITALMQGKRSPYETDLFAPIMEKLSKFATSDDMRAMRIIADHGRTSVFMVADGVLPGSTGRGYVLRRLQRRLRALRPKNLDLARQVQPVELVDCRHRHIQGPAYPEAWRKARAHQGARAQGRARRNFCHTLEAGAQEFNRKGTDPFVLATTYGFPIELTQELAQAKKTSTLDME